MQDSKKYIWICTDAGIVKYNANSFKTYNSANGLPDNTIFEVKEDFKGRIWFRSFSGKIGYIHNDTIVVPGANSEILSFIKDGIISSFAFDSFGNLYVGKRNTSSISFLKIRPPYSASDVQEIWKDTIAKRGITIVKIESDIVFSDVRAKPSIDYSIKIQDQKNTVIYREEFSYNLTSMYTCVLFQNNKFFLSTHKTFREITYPEGKAVFKEFNAPILSLSPLGEKVVIGQQLNNLSIYPTDTIKELSALPNRMSVTCVIEGYQKGIWIATLEKGVFFLSPDPITELSTTVTEGEFITCLMPFNGSDNNYLMGYNTGRLCLWHLTEESSNYTELIRGGDKEPGSILSIYKSGETNLIVSGASGTVELNLGKDHKKTNLKRNISLETPKKIFKYKDSLLFLYIKHLKVYNKKTGAVKPLLISTHRLNTAAYDSVNNKIYIGSLHGFYLYNNESNINDCKKILDSRIQDVIVRGNYIYAASKNDGLFILNGNQIDTISEKNGLLSNICRAINIRGNEIWVSTNKGLSKIEIFGDKRRITNFPISGFLGAPSVSRVEFEGDRILFYSEDRLFTFNDKNTESEGIVRIISMTANGKSIDISSPVRFNYNQTNIVINFEALFYDHGGIILYRYKLNSNSDWQYTTQSHAYFPNPNYGNYLFILQACDRSGKWISAYSPLEFIVAKPIWTNLWFILLAIAVFATLAAIIVRYRFATVLRKEKEKNKLRIGMLELESRIAKAQMNPHFIFNALNSIQQFILGKDNESAYRYLSKFAKLVRKLLETNTSESILLEDEIDLIKRYIEIESLRFEDSFLYEIEIDENLMKKGIRIPHMLIQPFVENAIWHGLRKKKENKMLNIIFREYSADCIICIVEDNGAGRDPKSSETNNKHLNKKSLAIDLIKQRMDLLRKSRMIDCGFEISDKKDQNNKPLGTYVRIVIPILKL